MANSALLKRAIQQMLDILEAEGQRILQECEAEHTYTHRTKNLYDSYGYGVYYKGKLKRKGFLSATATATESKKWYGKNVKGRDEIEKFFKGGFTPVGNAFELVIAAAMPYGIVLENASSGQKKKYQVISMAYDKLAALSGEFSGSTVRALTGGKI